VPQLLQFDQGEGAHAAGESTDAPGAARCGDEFDVN